MSHALVVFSGGQDSTTALYWALNNFDTVSAITFNYNQRHAAEIMSAHVIADMAGIKDRHRVVKIGGVLKSTSPLISNSQLDQYNNYTEMRSIVGDRIENTFVPMRNTLFLTIAANHAVSIDANVLVTGVCEADGANYPDCTTQFLYTMRVLINISLGIKDQSFNILAPLIDQRKSSSIKFALQFPGCYAALGYSCTAYDGSIQGRDHASILRAHGFEEAGIPDPRIVRAFLEGLIPYPLLHNYRADQSDLETCRKDLVQAAHELKEPISVWPELCRLENKYRELTKDDWRAAVYD